MVSVKNVGSEPTRPIQLDSGQIAALLMVGHTLFSQGQIEDAKKIFEGLAAVDNKNAYVHGILGAIYQRQEKYEAAIARYSMAIKMYPGDVNSLTNRGEIYLKCGRFKDAAADFKAAIDLDPDTKNPAANRARLLVALTTETLNLAKEKGVGAVYDAKKRIDQQIGAV